MKNTLSVLLSLASILKLGACQVNQTNGTLEIPFVVDKQELYGRDTYSINIELGTPPQVVPVVISSGGSNNAIYDATYEYNPVNYESTLKPNQYNPALSSTAKVGESNITLQRPATWDNATSRAGSNDAINATWFYSSDKYSIGSVALPQPLEFISNSSVISWSDSSKSGVYTSSTKYPHHNGIGLGLAEASVKNYVALQVNPSATIRGGVVDDLFNAGVIKSRSYSLWLDALEKRTGHLLFGGVNTKAYSGALISINASVRSNEALFYESAGLAINTSFSGTSGVPGVEGWNVSLGETILSTADAMWLSTDIILPVWDHFGVDYRAIIDDISYPAVDLSPGNLSYVQPAVPCSYKTNTTILHLTVTGTNLTVQIPTSDLVFSYQRSSFRNSTEQEVCILSIYAGAPGDPSVVGMAFLKHLYQVHDHDNKVISLAINNWNSAGESNVTVIPKEGGVTNSSVLNPKKNAAVAMGSSLASVTFGLVAVAIMALAL